ncbi:MAG TPA: phage tail protein [Gemmatimonadales bacterium]|jgi:phage tail-like protein
MPVTDRVLRIGRLPDNEMVLPHPTVSRQHAEVRIQNGRPVLTDLGSAAGTSCGGVRLAANQPVALEAGSDVRIGPYVLRFTPNAPAHAVLPEQPEVAEQRGPSGPLVAPEVIEELLIPDSRRPTYPVPLPTEAPSRYLQHLPAMFQEDKFLGRLLMIFEAVWEPLEWRQDHYHLYFDPRTSPASFLEWLAGWLNLTVNPHWPEDRRRRLLDEAMELYRWRGTPYGLTRMIEVCTGHGVQVVESGADPFTFRVRIPSEATGQRELIEQLVLTHKPAHVGYVLEVGV